MLLDQIIKYWNAATRQITLFGGLTLNGPLNGATTISGTALVGGLVNPVYGPVITCDCALGNAFIITITDGVAFAIAVPLHPTAGQWIRMQFVNASGGAAGAGTFNAVFKMVSNTLAVIANGSNRTVDFFYNGTNWIQVIYTADVPN